MAVDGGTIPMAQHPSAASVNEWARRTPGKDALILSRRFGVTIDCRQPAALAQFWCDLLGYEEEPAPAGYSSWQTYDTANGVTAAEAESGCTIIDPDGRGPRVYFQQVPEAKRGKNRVHLDIVASGRRNWTDVTTAAGRAVDRGGQVIRESDDPADRFIVLADPEGNEFCLVM
jgi:hypothetical protein